MIALNEDECWTSVGVRHGRALLLAACPVPVSRIEKSSHVFSTFRFDFSTRMSLVLS